MLAGLVLALLATVAASPFTRLDTRNNDGYKKPNPVRATWDGKCFYPTPDETFQLDAYLGDWYQIAGTLAPFTSGCTCISANYQLNVSPPCQLITELTLPAEQWHCPGHQRLPGARSEGQHPRHCVPRRR